MNAVELTEKETDVLMAICQENIEMTWFGEVYERLVWMKEKGHISWTPNKRAVGGLITNLEKKGYIHVYLDTRDMKETEIDGEDKGYEWYEAHFPREE